MVKETETLTVPELVELQIMSKLGELTRAAQKDMSKSRAPGATADRFALALAGHLPASEARREEKRQIETASAPS